MSEELGKQIIESYQKEENMMILVFAQWCVNHDLDPVSVYQKAYPDQGENQALKDGVALTVPKEEAGDVPDETLLGVLSAVDANVLDVSHVRTDPRLGLTEAEVELHLETKGPVHCAEVGRALQDAGYPVIG